MANVGIDSSLCWLSWALNYLRRYLSSFGSGSQRKEKSFEKLTIRQQKRIQKTARKETENGRKILSSHRQNAFNILAYKIITYVSYPYLKSDLKSTFHAKKPEVECFLNCKDLGSLKLVLTKSWPQFLQPYSFKRVSHILFGRRLKKGSPHFIC